MLLITILLGMPGLPQILLIALVLLLLFGGRKIPELMRGLGRGIKEFKSASSEEKKTDKEIKDNSES
ncbi:MAG: twin-arginine translocase TatA/TatE family subunit [Flavobacteriaceae bacterium]|nr:twin-arginine translocase TatA/TatE family subunit [Flavobacteriaceae bacterium]